MVVKRFKIFAFFFVWGFTVTGCNLDFLGLYFSTDLSTRWQARNTFNFLTESDLNMTFESGSYSFILLADPHMRGDNSRGLERLKYSIEQYGDKFVVVLGDITDSGRERDLQTFLDIARSFGVPVFPVIGNHDLFFGNWSIWKRLIGSTVYRVDIGHPDGTDTLLILDSANAYFGRRQFQWLDNELNEAGERVFVFSHFNLFAETFPGPAMADNRERAKMVSMLRGRAEAMFSGHAHWPGEREIGGVHYITLEGFARNSLYSRVWVSDEGIRWEHNRLR